MVAMEASQSRKNALMMAEEKILQPDGWIAQMHAVRIGCSAVAFAHAQRGICLVHQHNDEAGAPMLRSLESLRDLDYDSWRAVVSPVEIKAIPLF